MRLPVRVLILTVLALLLPGAIAALFMPKPLRVDAAFLPPVYADAAGASATSGSSDQTVPGRDASKEANLPELVYYRDADNDGYGDTSHSIMASTIPSGYAEVDGDCDDANARINPEAEEVCNALDDDCNGQVDEGVRTAFYRDGDGDGYGNSADFLLACTAPEGYVADATDCDDANGAVNPGAAESCNAVDDNCDGVADNDVPLMDFYEDADGDGFGNPARSGRACTPPPGWVVDGSDCDDDDKAVHPAMAEVCNNIDDNCDGAIDEGLRRDFYRDSDGDGYGAANAVRQACTPPTGYVTDATDCDDSAAAVFPGAEERCNAADDNCNGRIDEGVQRAYHADADGDGYGDPDSATHSCAAPAGHVGNSDDCRDNDPEIHPGAAEACNGLDDNCDGTVDEGVRTTFYFDADSDGYGQKNRFIQACSPTDGYVAAGTDCNDADAAIHPGVQEKCNAIDDNCDGKVDGREEGVECNTIPAAPQNVRASDLGAGLTAVKVTWQPSAHADDYVIYRSAWEPDGTYEKVADKVKGTSYLFEQDWDATYAQTGPIPTLVLTPDMSVREPFGRSLDNYMERALPVLLDFKAPAYFKVQACNELGCSPLSAADQGQAEMVHTRDFSEVAELFAPLFQYAVLRTLISAPPGNETLEWCGSDLCGLGGGAGMVMARMDTADLFNGADPQMNIYFENFSGAWDPHPKANIILDGYLGGIQPVDQVRIGKWTLSGDFDFQLAKAVYAQVFAWISFDGSTTSNKGYVTVTYNNFSYQFNLPLQPVDGNTVGMGAQLTPVDESYDDLIMDIEKRNTSYPVPFSEDPPAEGCRGITAEPDALPKCIRIPY